MVVVVKRLCCFCGVMCVSLTGVGVSGIVVYALSVVFSRCP